MKKVTVKINLKNKNTIMSTAGIRLLMGVGGNTPKHPDFPLPTKITFNFTLLKIIRFSNSYTDG